MASDPPDRPELAQWKKITTEIDTYHVDFTNRLGSGRFAKVYSAYSKRKEGSVAVKVLMKKETSKENLKNEVEILQKLKHPNIVKFYDCLEESDRIYIFTKKMETDMLEEILESAEMHLDERTTRFFIVQILEAVRYLHSKNVAHCDLKPENVLLQNVLSKDPHPFIQLCDFGYARDMNKFDRRDSVKGTPQYSAPELLLEIKYSRAIDIWSIGVIIFVSLTGSFPFDGAEAEDIAADIEKKLEKPDEMYPDAKFGEVSGEGVELMKVILSNRYSKLSVSQIFRSPWFYDEQLNEDLGILEKRLNARIYTDTLNFIKRNSKSRPHSK